MQPNTPTEGRGVESGTAAVGVAVDPGAIDVGTTVAPGASDVGDVVAPGATEVGAVVDAGAIEVGAAVAPTGVGADVEGSFSSTKSCPGEVSPTPNATRIELSFAPSVSNTSVKPSKLTSKTR